MDGEGVPSTHTGDAAPKLLSPGQTLAWGEPTNAANLCLPWPGTGLGESQWTEICGRVGHGS
jgi:hypothetical protein